MSACGVSSSIIRELNWKGGNIPDLHSLHKFKSGMNTGVTALSNKLTYNCLSQLRSIHKYKYLVFDQGWEQPLAATRLDHQPLKSCGRHVRCQNLSWHHKPMLLEVPDPAPADC